MATTQFHLAEANDLPQICACCGKKATTDRFEKFSYTPPWITFFLVFGILVGYLWLFFSRWEATVGLPVCEDHARRSKRARNVFLLGLLATALTVVAACVAYQFDDDIGLRLVLAAFGVFTLWSLAAIFCIDDQIRAMSIDERYITLTGVSEEFARAVKNGYRRNGINIPKGGVELQTAKYFKL